MFNIGFAELILVLLIAFLVVGPKDLPRVARWLGRLVKRARQLLREVRQEVGWDEIAEETQAIRQDIGQTVKETDISADLRAASKAFQQNVNEAKENVEHHKP